MLRIFIIWDRSDWFRSFKILKILLPDVSWTNFLKSQKQSLLKLPFFTSKLHVSILYLDNCHNLFWKSNVSYLLLVSCHNKTCTDNPNACSEKKDIRLNGWCNFLHFLKYWHKIKSMPWIIGYSLGTTLGMDRHSDIASFIYLATPPSVNIELTPHQHWSMAAIPSSVCTCTHTHVCHFSIAWVLISNQQ